MEKFAYASPKTAKDALALLSDKWGDTAVLAGGTDLISSMKDELLAPRLLVNIKGIPEMHGIKQEKGGLTIGAAVTLDEIAESTLIRKMYPSIHAAATGITSPQIRNMGTIGGDLCQRPRCWYFRNGFGLLAKTPKGEALVPTGENRYHAIINNSGPAFFVSPSSFGPALAALDAKIQIASASGTRQVAALDFFVSPKSESEREIALHANELVTGIFIPAAGANATYEIRERHAIDWPLATASVSLTMAGGKISKARVVLGHVAPTPFAATEADKFLAGKTIDEATAEAAGKAAVMSATPLSQNLYKVKLAQVAVKRALLEAAGKKA